MLKANGIDLGTKMGFDAYAYEPIVDACRGGDSAMVSLLLELGVKLADVGRPGRRLDWYKQYLRDDAVDSQLTALLPAELNARTNLEVRQEKERLEAAKQAEEQRLFEDETYVLDETTAFEGAHPHPHEIRMHTDTVSVCVPDCVCVRACVCARVGARACVRRDFQRCNWCLPARCTLYRLEKGENGTDEYKDFGSGILHLNKNKETGRRRVRPLARRACACMGVRVCVRACVLSRTGREAGDLAHTTDTWRATVRCAGAHPT